MATNDGMLLNFELPTEALAPKQTFKGGSWKDRLTAKKSAQWGQKKAQERGAVQRKSIPQFQNVGSEDEELKLPNNTSNKRAKTSEDGVFKRSERNPQPGASRNPPIKASNREVISSLFTFNPKAAASHDKAVPENETEVEPSNAPLHDDLTTFTSLGLSSTLAKHLLTKLEIRRPTAIQRKAVERLCVTSSDAFIQAETGSGKTLAYLLPIVQQITDLSKRMKERGESFDRESGLFALILAPTRELSKQINTVLESLLSCCHWIVGGTVIGGEKKKSEKARLRKGLNVLVATPGRLVDHLDNTEVLDVGKVRWLVLDEGDRLMELGFEKDIQKIMSVLNLRSKTRSANDAPELPNRRTTILCSATLKADVERLKNLTLKNPASISVDPKEMSDSKEGLENEMVFSAPSQLKLSYAVVPTKQRLVTLLALLKQTFKRKGSVAKCIVFMSCADSVDFHFEILTSLSTGTTEEGSHDDSEEKPLKRREEDDRKKISQGSTITDGRTEGRATIVASKENPVEAFRLHGSLQQATRTKTLRAFTKSTLPSVLVCTDVASRGLDLPNIDFIIEYDPPFSKEDHLHRIGRTARAGRDGRAMVFLMPGCEESYVEILKEGRPRNLTRHDADELLKKGFSSTGVQSAHHWEDRATDLQLEIERWALENPKHLEQARRAFQSHVRAYATHVASERQIFDMQQLHLGHLAKAFALRDKPGNIRVPGSRPGESVRNKTNKARQVQAAKNAGRNSKRAHNDNEVDAPAISDEQSARKKMYASVRRLGGSSEFNLG